MVSIEFLHNAHTQAARSRPFTTLVFLLIRHSLTNPQTFSTPWGAYNPKLLITGQSKTTLSQPSKVPIYTPGLRVVFMVKYLAQGHKCHDWESNLHSDDSTTELESDAVDRLATRYHI